MPRIRPRLKEHGIKMVVHCRACGWKWEPKPKMWRNKRNPISGRTLKCPSCGIPNRLKREDVKRIWKYNY